MPGQMDRKSALLAHFERAVALYKEGRIGDSISEFQAALAADPTHAPSYYNLALRLEAQGRKPEAAAAFEGFLAHARAEELQLVDAVRARIAGLRPASAAPRTATLAPSAEPEGAAPTPAPITWTPGQLVDGLLEVREVLGEGGFGTVHRVYHRDWGLDLAVKAPRADRVANRRALEGFVQEANTWVGLGLHPHIVTCCFVRVMGVPRIFVEFMAGGSLADWIAQGRPADLPGVLDAAVQIAWAMDYAHSKGLVHRDLKPANCLMTPGGVLKVTDFGLARVGDGVADDAPSGARIAKLKPGTQSGRMGTPEYMAPEQWQNPRAVGPKADIWAFGAALYELAAKRRPFAPRENEPWDSFYARLLASDWSYSPLPADLPRPVAALVASCLSPEPAKRPASFREVAECLLANYGLAAGRPYPRPAPRDPPLLADTLVNQGVSMADLGRTEEALRLFDKALELEAGHTAAVYNRGLAAAAKAGAASSPQYRPVLPRSSEGAGLEDSAFKALLAKAGQLCTAGAHAESYEMLLRARGLRGYSNAEEALELARALSLRGRRAEPTGAWPARLLENSEGARALAAAPDGRFVVTGHEDGSVRTWEAARDWRCLTLGVHKGPVTALCSSADGRRALSGGKDGVLRVWDLTGAAAARSLEGHLGSIRALDIAPTGLQAVTGGDDGMLRCWDLESGARRAFSGHRAAILAARYLPDGTAFLSLSADGTLRRWGVRDDAPAWTSPAGTALSLSCSATGRHALTAGAAGELHLWDAATGRLEASAALPVRAASHAFTPDGRWAVLSLEDGGLDIRAVPSLESRARAPGHAGRAAAVALSPDAGRAFTAGPDGAHVWSLDWRLEFPAAKAWDAGAEPFVAVLLARRGAAGKPSAEELRALRDDLSRRGFGWLSEGGLRERIETGGPSALETLSAAALPALPDTSLLDSPAKLFTLVAGASAALAAAFFLFKPPPREDAQETARYPLPAPAKAALPSPQRRPAAGPGLTAMDGADATGLLWDKTVRPVQRPAPLALLEDELAPPGPQARTDYLDREASGSNLVPGGSSFEGSDFRLLSWTHDWRETASRRVTHVLTWEVDQGPADTPLVATAWGEWDPDRPLAVLFKGPRGRLGTQVTRRLAFLTPRRPGTYRVRWTIGPAARPVSSFYGRRGAGPSLRGRVSWAEATIQVK